MKLNRADFEYSKDDNQYYYIGKFKSKNDLWRDIVLTYSETTDTWEAEFRHPSGYIYESFMDLDELNNYFDNLDKKWM